MTFEEREAVPLVPGSLVSVPAGLAHRIEAAADSRMVVIYTTNAGYTSVRPPTESRDKKASFFPASRNDWTSLLLEEGWPDGVSQAGACLTSSQTADIGLDRSRPMPRRRRSGGG